MKGKIIVVDDSEIVRDFTKTVLESAGFAVTTMESPLRLPVVIRSEQPNVVLLDVNMPSLRGDRAFQISKELGLPRGTAVVYFSDRAEAELQELVERTGAAGYIKKSGDTAGFVTAVSKWVEVSKKVRG